MKRMATVSKPRITIAALKGGSGKTLVSLGLISAWREDGFRVAPFKKGPDFIDAGWMRFAAGRYCYNLDSFMMDGGQILGSFQSNSNQTDLSIIEGNRGLYDGLDLEGRHSTAELAKLLQSPVIIILDVTMSTRTMAAVVKGCQAFDPDLDIAGVILNRVAGPRQERLIRKAIEKYCGIMVVGSIPKLKEDLFPERHMGLIPYQERDHSEKAVSWAKNVVRENLQLDEIRSIATNVQPMDSRLQDTEGVPPKTLGAAFPRIGFIRDNSFWFYYPENLQQLEQMGAQLVEINAVNDSILPQIDALYIGGGFPETQARALSDNQTFRDCLKNEIEKGLPVYAECGGFMYLGECLVVGGTTYPMVDALPVRFILEKKPQGHGYTILEVERTNPYYPVGTVVKGHEFHYSKAVLTGEAGADCVFKVKRGHGIDGHVDGICKKNLLATYTHVHAAGNDLWAKAFFRAAIDFKKTI